MTSVPASAASVLAGGAAAALRAAASAASASAVPGAVVRVHTTRSEIDALRPAWEALRPGPSADPDSVLALAETRAAVIAPHVFAMSRGARVEALLVARVEEHEVRCRIGHRDLYRPRVRALAIDYGCALRSGPDVSWAPLVGAVRDALREGVAVAAHFRRVAEDSDLLADVRAQGARVWRNESEAPELHWSVDLPSTFDAFLQRAGSRTRKSLRRDRRMVERDFAGSFRIRRTTLPEDVAGFCARAEGVARSTYQRGLATGFVHDAEYEARLLASARRGRLRAYELEAGGAVRAFWIGEVHAGTHFVDSTAFLADFGAWSPGKLLRLEATRDMIEEGVTSMDFGFGDAEYKRQFGAEARRERDVYLFAPGVRGAWLNAVRCGFAWAAAGARAAADRGGVLDALRRTSRRRAALRTADALRGEEPACGMTEVGP